jgi:hypothetical protein
MPILEEGGTDDMLFQQYGAPPRFHKEVVDFLNSKIPDKMDWKGRASHMATSIA